MADFLHFEATLGTRQGVSVDLNRAADVMLLTQLNFQSYRAGRRFEYYGGHARRSPAVIFPPRAGNYHVVVDAGRGHGLLKAKVSVVDG